jgi:hypothetical protein
VRHPRGVLLFVGTLFVVGRIALFVVPASRWFMAPRVLPSVLSSVAFGVPGSPRFAIFGTLLAVVFGGLFVVPGILSFMASGVPFMVPSGLLFIVPVVVRSGLLFASSVMVPLLFVAPVILRFVVPRVLLMVSRILSMSVGRRPYATGPPRVSWAA